MNGIQPPVETCASPTPRFGISPELHERIDLLFKMMKEEGVDEMKVPYSGSGDSGDFYDPYAEAGNEPSVEIQKIVWHIAYQAVSSRHLGWENNDGGEGTVTFKLRSEDDGCQVISVDHSDFWTDSDCSDGTFFSGEWNEETDSEISSLFRAMNDNGIPKIIVTYSGGGDSGDIDDISVDGAGASTDLAALGLEEPVREIAWKAIEQKNSGWENNEGGSGTVSFILKDEELNETLITTEHHNNFGESDSDQYDFYRALAA
jgi:hypothetical protein